MYSSFEFSDIIARRPGSSVVRGLRDGTGPDPDPALFLAQHARYLAVMRELGVSVAELPALEDFPDSVFVEDAALVFGDTAIALNPGAASRQGETAALLPALQNAFRQIMQWPQDKGDACVDGGDVLIGEQEVFVGQSARTNSKGVDVLSSMVRDLGYRLRPVITPPSILHFKTACGLLDAETIFATKALAASGCFSGYRLIKALDDEQAAANLVRINEQVLLAEGYPKTRELLEQHGYQVRTIDISEAARIDGGLSCMSLRFNRHYSPGK